MSARIVIIGGGFSGFHAAHWICHHLAEHLDGELELTLINPTDYFLYVPLLPEVSAGILDPRRVAVPLAGALPKVKLVLGSVQSIDADARRIVYRDADGELTAVDYDHVLITCGSVNKLLPIPGVAEHAIGFRNLAEAVYLRDHMVRQIQLADQAEDAAERDARLTFVVVGAGYTGTEVATQGARFTGNLLAHHARLAGARLRWMLLDTAPRVLPGLNERLAGTAQRVLEKQGVDVRTGTSVREATATDLELTDGSRVPTRSLIWCVGVRPDPLVSSLGLETNHGRLIVNADLSVPGRAGMWACGDAAAVPDLAQRKKDSTNSAVTAMTAQHAQRQGVRAAKNIAAALGHGKSRRYKHRNLGFVVDLSGFDAAADPLGVPLSGLPAKVVTRGYHLVALPHNRVRTATQWLTHALLGPEDLQLDLVSFTPAPLETTAPPASS